MHISSIRVKSFNYIFSGDLLGDLPANASEDEIAARLAAAGVSGEAAKKMMSAVKAGGGGRKYYRVSYKYSLYLMLRILQKLL